MAKTRYFIIDPKGDVHTRNSDRVYTHAVVYQASYTQAVMDADDKSWQAQDARDYNFYTSRNDERVAGLTKEQYVQKQLTDRKARVEDARQEGYYDRWYVEGFCGRYDLAQKLLSSSASARRINGMVLGVQVR